MTLTYYWNSIMTHKEREIMTSTFREKDAAFSGRKTDIDNAKHILWIAFIHSSPWSRYWQSALRRMFGEKWVARALAMNIQED